MICVTLERTPVTASKCGSENESKIAVYKWLNLKSADWRTHSCGSKETCVRWGPDPPREGAPLGSGDVDVGSVEVIAGNRTKLADSQERQYGSDRAAT